MEFIRCENAGMSSVKFDVISDHLKPKGSLAMYISQGLVGPKLRPKGVGDGRTG